mmetsp:Transcript_27804/g.55677  ORF Transcript_27804/g.55677 Transcript_27804/m.55677 type:complete len:345 (-) Transcript_27804:814-1848(-)
MSSPSHNERIAARRLKTSLDFVELTSTNGPTAAHYLKLAAFDLERAVSLFYDAGAGALPSDDNGSESEPVESRESSMGEEDFPRNTEDSGAVDSIMNAAKEATPSSSSFGGQGSALNSSRNRNDEEPPALTIRVVFYKDGFTTKEVEEETQPKFRRRGVHSFSSPSSSMPSRLPPLRNYDEDAQFIEDVRQNRVPAEYRRLDARNRPVAISILLEDRRSVDYPADRWRAQQPEDNNGFGGSGETLGGGVSVSPRRDARVRHEGDGVLSKILGALVYLWIRLLFFFRSAASHRPPSTTRGGSEEARDDHRATPAVPTRTDRIQYRSHCAGFEALLSLRTGFERGV